ncbi:MAG: NAD(P)/FAD-dependent oxidoreductase [Oscillospiraceae bacterium]|nr:NAD(P)/FAD-dependent oxidoreductase [Oscillospiraceae bacterium]
MVYDYIIVGGGPSGATAAYCLQRRGFSCLLLEAQSPKLEKTCGGYLTWTGVKLLKSIGLDPEVLLCRGACRLDSLLIQRAGIGSLHNYHSGEFGIGTRRLLLDQWLLDCAADTGVDIKYGCAVNKYSDVADGYNVMGFTGRHIVFATGARGFSSLADQQALRSQTFGISAQIYCEGTSTLQCNRIYFWFLQSGFNDYFWAIPIGASLWNIGIWLQRPSRQAKVLFEENQRRWIDPEMAEWHYIRPPMGAFCGNVDLSKNLPTGCYGLGDFAGCNITETGEGLRYAIASAISFASQTEGE